MKKLISQRLRTAGRQLATSTSAGRRLLGLEEGTYKAARELPVWDAKWYEAAYPDIRTTGMSPLFHFLRFGLAEGRNPGPYYDLRNRMGERHESLKDDPQAYVTALIADVQQTPILSRLKNPEDLIARSGLFDPKWYLEAHPDVARKGMNPLEHYLEHGGPEFRAPGPRFDPVNYVYEHALAGLQPFNPLVHYLVNDGDPKGNVVDRAHYRQEALKHTRAIYPLEPDLLVALRQLEDGSIPVVGGRRSDRVGPAWRRLCKQLHGTYRYVILVPWVTHGGADLVALYAARLALETYSPEEVLLIVTDTDNLAAKDWLPPGLHTLVLPQIGPSLTEPEQVELLLMTIRALKPRALLNVNSRIGWELYEQYARPLSQFMQLFATLFCPDYDSKGLLMGYAHRYFRSTLPHLTAIYFDNAAFIEELWDHYVPAARLRNRLRVVYQPARPVEGYHPLADPRHPCKVLWAGRFCAQKNLSALLALAKADASFQYEVYGRGDALYTDQIHRAEQTLPNLKFHGSYPSFERLPLSRFGAYVYTTLWDGLPNALLEAASAGIPIVAPAVGGIGELVTAETGWLISDPEDIEAYVQALKQIRDNPAEVSRRTNNMRDLIATRHSWAAYKAAMFNKPAFLET